MHYIWAFEPAQRKVHANGLDVNQTIRNKCSDVPNSFLKSWWLFGIIPSPTLLLCPCKIFFEQYQGCFCSHVKKKLLLCWAFMITWLLQCRSDDENKCPHGLWGETEDWSLCQKNYVKIEGYSASPSTQCKLILFLHLCYWAVARAYPSYSCEGW
jgi:hypothetical protein